MKLKILSIVLFSMIFASLQADNLSIDQPEVEQLIFQILQDIEEKKIEVSQEAIFTRLVEIAENSDLFSSTVFGVDSWETIGILLGVGALICCTLCTCAGCGICLARNFCKSIFCCP